MKKKQLGLMVASAVGAAALLPNTTNAQMTAFGLANRSILGAIVERDSRYPWLHVGDLSRYGYKGLSIDLGEADSGLYFTPSTRATLEDGYFMSGHAYGKVGFLNRRLSSVFCERTDWATFPVSFDFSPIGSFHKTVFAYFGDTLVATVPFSEGGLIVSSSNDSNLGPRVNPFWRAPDGTFGALLEFASTPPITLPNGQQIYATKLFIRAENPLFDPEYVSRVDIYGGGGLPEFSALDERLGMFSRPHRALGSATFDAKDGRLTINGCDDAGSDGVLVELKNNAAFQATLRPLSLDKTGAVFSASATSVTDRYFYYSPPIHLGSLTVENRAGEKQFRVGFDEHVELVRVDAFRDGVPAGHALVSSAASASLGTNDARIASIGAIGTSGTNHAAMQIGFARPVTMQFDGATLRGNQFTVSLHQPTNEILGFSSVQMLACGTAFTITSEKATPLPAPELAIRRDGTNIVLSWPAYALEHMSVEDTERIETAPLEWRFGYSNLRQAGKSRVETVVPLAWANRKYFRLVNYYARYYSIGE